MMLVGVVQGRLLQYGGVEAKVACVFAFLHVARRDEVVINRRTEPGWVFTLMSLCEVPRS